MAEQGCFLSNAGMEKLRWASQQVGLAIERHRNQRASLENDEIYKQCYPIVLTFEDKLVEVLDRLIEAEGISLVLNHRIIPIVRAEQQPGGIQLHTWGTDEGHVG